MLSRALVLGMGNACLDTLLAVERLPAAGEKVRLLSWQQLPGGQVAGAMVGCARLGLKAGILLRTGDDAAGARIRTALADAGVDLSRSRILAGLPSATAHILRDPTGERAVIWNTHSELAVAAEEITPALLDGTAALFFDGKDGAACLRAAELAHHLGIPVIADLDFHYPHTAALLPWIDHLIVPAAFAAAADITGTKNATVVVTEGSAGAVGWERGGSPVRSPVFDINVVDTTGAGDAFHAGYIYALLQGWDLTVRLRFANATAALACTAPGAQNGLPTLTQVETLLERVEA